MTTPSFDRSPLPPPPIPAEAPNTSRVTFSVVIPTYNYAHYLPRALESVLAQSTRPIQLIVVDDGSTDHTPEVMGAYVGRSETEVIALRQANQGPSAARNRGIREATADYIVFLDADDALLPDALQTLAARIEEFGHPAMVFGGHVSVSAEGERTSSRGIELSGDRRQDFATFIAGRFKIATGSAAIRREVFDTVSYPEDLRNNEDLIVDAAILANNSCRSFTRPVVEIHSHGGRLRNTVSLGLDNARDITDRIFGSGSLPPDLAEFRRPFLARRYLSRFRSFYRAGEFARAWENYRKAFLTAPRLALKPEYVVKALKSVFGRSARNRQEKTR